MSQLRLRRLRLWRMVIAMALTAPQVDEAAVIGPRRRGLIRDQVMTASQVGDLTPRGTPP